MQTAANSTTTIFLTETFAIPSKEEFDNGIISADYNLLVNILRTFFITSNSIRKKRNLVLAITDENIVVEISGEHVKYMAADFRSMASVVMNFLRIVHPISNKKVLQKKREILKEKGEIIASPGILLKKVENLRAEDIVNKYRPNLYELKGLINSEINREDPEIKSKTFFVESKSKFQPNFNILINLLRKPLYLETEIPILLFDRDVEEKHMEIPEKIMWLNYLEDYYLCDSA